MTNRQEKEITKAIKARLEEVKIQGIRVGAKGILGAILKMCNEGKSVNDIKEFCQNSLYKQKNGE